MGVFRNDHGHDAYPLPPAEDVRQSVDCKVTIGCKVLQQDAFGDILLRCIHVATKSSLDLEPIYLPSRCQAGLSFGNWKFDG